MIGLRQADVDAPRYTNEPPRARRVCVIGSGTRFLSGISYYTLHLASALAARTTVSVILMRQLIPRGLYPGKNRVGLALTGLCYPSNVSVYDGVDWFWGLTIVRGLRHLWRERPECAIFQWWTGAVLHTYLALALCARAQGARIIIEFHEMQDTGEARLPLARGYARVLGGLLTVLADGYVIHSEFDRPALERQYRIGRKPVSVIPHGPFGHHRTPTGTVNREAPDEACNFVFFGTIRPYKGVEDLVAAFEQLADQEPSRYWLTVLGETWEGWTLPTEMVERSRHRHRITLVNRYLTDDEASAWLAGADVSVLPYRRSSASGPLHLSMSLGLPTVVTAVGGLPEAVSNYGGAVLAPARDPCGLAEAMLLAAPMRGVRYDDPHSWDGSVDGLLGLVREISAGHRPRPSGKFISLPRSARQRLPRSDS